MTKKRTYIPISYIQTYNICHEIIKIGNKAMIKKKDILIILLLNTYATLGADIKLQKPSNDAISAKSRSSIKFLVNSLVTSIPLSKRVS